MPSGYLQTPFVILNSSIYPEVNAWPSLVPPIDNGEILLYKTADDIAESTKIPSTYR